MNDKKFKHQDYVPCKLWRFRLFHKTVGCIYCPYSIVDKCPCYTMQHETSPIIIMSNLIKKGLGAINK